MCLEQFQNELASIIGRPSDHRPFVCDGNPFDCAIMLVGSNAATKLLKGFWEYWSPTYGFDKTQCLSNYIIERKYREEHFEISPTRRRIEWICQSAAPARCVETNLYSIASKRTAELKSEDKGTKVLALLIEKVKPLVIFVHGKEATVYFEGLCRHKFVDGHPERYLISDLRTTVISGSHLFNWSEAKARQLGDQLRVLSAQSQGHEHSH